MNLLQRLSEACPSWRTTISRDPITAALELGLIEPDELDVTPLDFQRPDYRLLHDYADDRED